MGAPPGQTERTRMTPTEFRAHAIAQAIASATARGLRYSPTAGFIDPGFRPVRLTELGCPASALGELKARLLVPDRLAAPEVDAAWRAWARSVGEGEHAEGNVWRTIRAGTLVVAPASAGPEVRLYLEGIGRWVGLAEGADEPTPRGCPDHRG